MPFATWLGQILAPIITPIIKDAVREAFNELVETRAVVSKPNDDLQRMWESPAGAARNGDDAGKGSQG
jgi:hypothetical protein